MRSKQGDLLATHPAVPQSGRVNAWGHLSPSTLYSCFTLEEARGQSQKLCRRVSSGFATRQT